MKELQWNDIKKLSFSERGLIRGKEQSKCVVCGIPTYIYDISFGCPVHPKCQVKLDNEYMKVM